MLSNLSTFFSSSHLRFSEFGQHGFCLCLMLPCGTVKQLLYGCQVHRRRLSARLIIGYFWSVLQLSVDALEVILDVLKERVNFIYPCLESYFTLFLFLFLRFNSSSKRFSSVCPSALSGMKRPIEPLYKSSLPLDSG